MSLVRRVARPLLAAMFVSGGIDALRDPAPRAKQAEAIEPQLKKIVPQLDTDLQTLVRANGAAQVVGGLALAAGVFPRLAATGLAVSLVPTTLAGHRFWEQDDPAQRRNQRIHLTKNLGLLGGLLLAAVDTEGEPGLAWRARHAGEELQATGGRLRRRARREAAVATRAARQEAKLLRAEAKARLAA